MTKMTSMVAVAMAVWVLAASAWAANGPTAPRQERVTFAKGASSATIKGTLKGDNAVDYVIRAGAGQTLSVALKGSNSQNYFNVMPPGSDNVAMYVAQDGRGYTGMLPTDGDYKIRVYLMRPAARRNESSSYTLTVGVSGTPLPALPAAQDALVKGTPYHAAAEVKCLPPYASAPATCDAGVVRRGRDGTATVTASVKGGAVARRILFVQGKPVASDATEAIASTREGDGTIVKIGDERYDIPDVLLTGG